MELMASTAIRAGASLESARRILDCVATEAAYDVVCEEGLGAAFTLRMMERIDFYLKKRAAGRLAIECVVFTKTHGIIGQTPGAAAMMKRIVEASV